MSTTSQSIVNHSLFEKQDISFMSSQLGINFPIQTNLISLPPLLGFNQPLKTFVTVHPSSLVAELPLTVLSDQSIARSGDDFTARIGGSEVLFFQRSSANNWDWGELNDCMNMKKKGRDHDNLGVSAMKKIDAFKRKVRDPRFCFKTMSDVDVLDDGYKWRKYGQKVVKNTQHPRSYYRCTEDKCRVKKRVERLAVDPRMVITTYEGRHIHSPSQDHDEDQIVLDSQASGAYQLNKFFW